MARSEQAKEAQRLYIREWRKRNPDKVRAIQDRYWEKRLAKMKAEENAACVEMAESEVVQK
jgi:hypothetical protein